MNMLAPAAFERARAFVLQHARPLDQALFATWFEGGDPAAIEAALGGFQNAEGGFGKGLEPDVRLPASSAIATTIGLQYLRTRGAHTTSPKLKRALAYVVATFDAERGAWQKVPNDVTSAPHAFWWGEPTRPEGFEANVGAEMLGYAYRWPEHFPPELLVTLESGALEAIQAMGATLEMHDALAWLRLAEEPATPAGLKAALLTALERALPGVVALDPADWGGYVLRPLQVAPTPGAAMAKLVKDGLAADLDATIAAQGADGSWSPPWDWGQYPESWPQAKREWQGCLTVQQLKVLADHGRREA